MKKILVNAYYNLNLGDDLFLKVLFDRYPNTQWDLLTNNKMYNEIFRSNKNVKILRTISAKIFGRNLDLFSKLNDYVFNYKKYDAFVNIGGSIFMENRNWRTSIKERSNIPKRFKSSNRPSFIIGSNFGPYQDELYVEKHKQFFSLFDDICFRDEYSFNIFQNLQNTRLAPDVVFSLNEKFENTIKEKSVGISIIDLEKRGKLKDYKKDYKNKMIHIIEAYINRGYQIKLFSFCENEGDLKAISEIIDELKNNYIEYVKVVNYKGDIKSTLDEFKTCETIVGTRFHSIILALVFNQNIYPLIYSDKTYNILHDINMTSVYSYIEDIDCLDVEETIDRTQNNKLINREILFESERQFEGLDNFINKRFA